MNKGLVGLTLEYADKEAITSLGGLNVLVRIKDIRTSYGRLQFLISPQAGNGEVWRDEGSVKVLGKGK